MQIRVRHSLKCKTLPLLVACPSVTITLVHRLKTHANNVEWIKETRVCLSGDNRSSCQIKWLSSPTPDTRSYKTCLFGITAIIWIWCVFGVGGSNGSFYIVFSATTRIIHIWLDGSLETSKHPTLERIIRVINLVANRNVNTSPNQLPRGHCGSNLLRGCCRKEAEDLTAASNKFS